MSFDLVLAGGRVVLPWGEETTDIGVRQGRIAALGDLSRAAAGHRLECRGLHVLPGLIDAHVHLRDPFNGVWGEFLKTDEYRLEGGEVRPVAELEAIGGYADDVVEAARPRVVGLRRSGATDVEMAKPRGTSHA